MDPKEYYYQTFHQDLVAFLNQPKSTKLSEEGEVCYDAAIFADEECFSVVPLYRREYFIFFLALTLLLDNIIAKHFPYKYPEFRQITQYPKFKDLAANGFVHAWDVAKYGKSMELFEQLCRFFIEDLRQFFDAKNELDFYWFSLNEAFLLDQDLKAGKYGEIFLANLKAMAE